MKFYAALLYLFPAGFRNEYGAEMASVFKRKQRDVTGLMTLALWLETVVDVFYNAARVHLDILGQDLKYTVRGLRRSPGFALTAIAVAALGIGATTAAFAMLDHVILKPLPFSDQERLMQLFEDHSFSAGNAGQQWDMAPANYRDWKKMSTSFEAVGCYRGLAYNLIGEGEPRHLAGSAMTAELLPMLGVKPIIGHWFTEADDRDGAPGTVLLSYAFWQSDFGGSLDVLGRKILLDSEPFTVIGVMPKDFYFPNRIAQIWTPMRFAPVDFEDRNNNYVYGLGKLKSGFALSTAQAEMRTIASQLSSQYPKELAHVGATIVSLRDDVGVEAKLMIEALLAASGCVLLVAAMNLANLLLARALERSREIAVRTAIGAGRERLIRQMVTESLLLSISGGVLGILIAASALPLLVKLVPVYLPIAEMPPVDLRFLFFALSITSVTGVAFGLVPALRVSRGGGMANGLREAGRSGGGRREALRSTLVLAEIAGSMVLLVCCALLVRALGKIEQVDPGFRAAGVMTARTSLPMPKYETVPARERFYREVLSKVEALPGVDSAAFTSFLPMVNRGGLWPVAIPGQTAKDPSSLKNASLRFVSPGFFKTMGIPLHSGRDLERSDSPKSRFVAVVSDSFVRYYWPGQNPLGRTFQFGNYDRIVVGVVGDVRVRGLERESEPQVYLPYLQHDKVSSWYAPKDLVIRATGDLLRLVPAIREIVHQVDPAQPLSDIRSLSDIVDAETLARRVQVIALSSFAAIAFLLAAIGIHGLLSFGVNSRRREIAVRVALGASARNVVGTLVAEAATLTGAGLVVGCLVAFAAAKQMQALLAGVTPEDWLSYTAAGVLCLLMVLGGSLVPAVRALRIDPAIAIRTE